MQNNNDHGFAKNVLADPSTFINLHAYQYLKNYNYKVRKDMEAGKMLLWPLKFIKTRKRSERRTRNNLILVQEVMNVFACPE